MAMNLQGSWVAIVNDINYFKSMHLCAILQLEVQYI